MSGVKTDKKTNVKDCPGCGEDHVEKTLWSDDGGLFYVCCEMRVDVRQSAAAVDDLKAREEVAAKLIAPLVERIDAAEKAAEAYRGECGRLDAKLRTEADEREKLRLDEARKRFRASCAVQLISGQMGANAFDWMSIYSEVSEAFDVVDAVMKKAGL